MGDTQEIDALEEIDTAIADAECEQMEQDIIATLQLAKAEITRLRSELEKARSLLHNAPILKIDMQVAKRLGETEAVAYAQALAKWTPLAEAFLASSPPVPEQKD